MFESLLETLAGSYDFRRHHDLLTAVWEQERWFDTPHQHAAAEIMAAALSEGGLAGVELAEYPADGKTMFQNWRTHMAWECPAARLAFADGGETLADRSQCPQAVVYWSGPLAGENRPAVGEVVDGDAMETITPEAVKGKYVLTNKPPMYMKDRLLGTNPLAVVSDAPAKGNGYDEHTTKWWNGWGDGPGGWYVHADDTLMPGFVLSAAASARLRRRLATDPHLKLAGFCDSRLYEGHAQNVTGFLEGADGSREIWLYGHACEVGAHDNASGVTVMIETLRLLKELIDAGKLPRPRHSIRMITTEECLGMVAFGTLHDDLRRRALAGMNLDGIGDASREDWPYYLNYGPLSNPTAAWPVGVAVCQAVQKLAAGRWHFRTKRFLPAADDMIAEPLANVPGLWLGTGGDSLGYHSSSDTPDTCTEDGLKYNLLVAAGWAYAMASLDGPIARELISPAREWIAADLLGDGDGDAALLRRWAAGRVLRDLARWGVKPEVYEPAARQYAPADAPPLPHLPTDGPVFRRKTWGVPTLAGLSHERRASHSSWSAWTNSALFWCDGKRSLPAVERLARAETANKSETKLEDFFAKCIEAGVVVRANQA